jgi:hypothetical protein
MSFFTCGVHGWVHLLKPCPQCITRLVPTNSSFGGLQTSNVMYVTKDSYDTLAAENEKLKLENANMRLEIEWPIVKQMEELRLCKQELLEAVLCAKRWCDIGNVIEDESLVDVLNKALEKWGEK